MGMWVDWMSTTLIQADIRSAQTASQSHVERFPRVNNFLNRQAMADLMEPDFTSSSRACLNALSGYLLPPVRASLARLCFEAVPDFRTWGRLFNSFSYLLLILPRDLANRGNVCSRRFRGRRRLLTISRQCRLPLTRVQRIRLLKKSKV